MARIHHDLALTVAHGAHGFLHKLTKEGIGNMPDPSGAVALLAGGFFAAFGPASFAFGTCVFSADFQGFDTPEWISASVNFKCTCRSLPRDPPLLTFLAHPASAAPHAEKVGENVVAAEIVHECPQGVGYVETLAKTSEPPAPPDGPSNAAWPNWSYWERFRESLRTS